jgi:hypothetical protein
MITFFNGRTRTLGGEASEVFAKVDVAFRDYIHLFKGANLAVFLAIALHADGDGWAWPSYPTLACETGYSEGTIRRALAHLCKLEINGHRVLLRYQPKAHGGTFESNRYLLFPSSEEVAQHEGRGITHLGAGTGGGFDDRGDKTTPRSPWCEKPSSQNDTTNKNQSEQEKKERKEGTPAPADAPAPLAQAITATWLTAAGSALAEDDLETLLSLLRPGPGQTDLTSLLATIVELGRRVAHVTPDLVVAVVSGRMGMPPLRPEPLPLTPVVEAPPVVTQAESGDDPVLAQVMAWYLEEISRRITPMVADDLRDLTQTQRELDVWQYAFAASRNIGNPINRWKYITSVVLCPNAEAVEDWVRSGKRWLPRVKAAGGGKESKDEEIGSDRSGRRGSPTGGRRRQGRRGRYPRAAETWTPEEIEEINRRAAIELGEIPDDGDGGGEEGGAA